jgi:ribosomal protein S18 acetylase RimI-like enzyme
MSKCGPQPVHEPTNELDMLDDAELARRSILGFGEMLAVLGRWAVGADAELRRPDALGARIDAAAGNPWLNAAVVPPGMPPPADGPRLPYCLWALTDAAPGRVEQPALAMPCMGVELDDPALALDGDVPDTKAPSLTVLGDLNERAYGQIGVFSPLVRALRDDRVRTYGLCDDGTFVCVALTLAIGDDISIQYVATEASHRRRGLASRLLLAMMATARNNGMRSATLQASPDGLPVYDRLGFRRVATLRAYLRPNLVMADTHDLSLTG